MIGGRVLKPGGTPLDELDGITACVDTPIVQGSVIGSPLAVTAFGRMARLTGA